MLLAEHINIVIFYFKLIVKKMQFAYTWKQGRHSTCARKKRSNKHQLNNIKVSKLASKNTLYEGGLRRIHIKIGKWHGILSEEVSYTSTGICHLMCASVLALQLMMLIWQDKIRRHNTHQYKLSPEGTESEK